MVKTYNESELLEFCDSREKFKDVKADFSNNMPLRDKVRRLIEYCDRHSFSQDLWDEVKKARPESWEEYEMPNEKPTSDAEHAQGVISGMMSSARQGYSQAESVKTHHDTTHPLLKDEKVLKKWFSENLDPDEQIFFLTAVLFSGVEKHEFLSLYEGINQELQPDAVDNSEGDE